MSTLSAGELFGVKGMVFVITGGGSGMFLHIKAINIRTNKCAGIGAMMAKALDINGAKKVYIVGRRLEKLQEVASAAVSITFYFLLNSNPAVK
jgi:NAD(P)-dependent dehydrogenase (short-subunit alcohol dehydrogenase family)